MCAGVCVEFLGRRRVHACVCACACGCAGDCELFHKIVLDISPAVGRACACTRVSVCACARAYDAWDCEIFHKWGKNKGAPAGVCERACVRACACGYAVL